MTTQAKIARMNCPRPRCANMWTRLSPTAPFDREPGDGAGAPVGSEHVDEAPDRDEHGEGDQEPARPLAPWYPSSGRAGRDRRSYIDGSPRSGRRRPPHVC